MAVKIVGQDQPWSVPGPDGPVSVLGVVFEGEEAVIDNGALHSRSRLEGGVRMWTDPSAKDKGERVVNVWVAFPGRGPRADKYLGVQSVELWVDRARGVGFKDVAGHVNRMSAAVRGRVDVVHLNDAQKKSVAALLEALSPEGWKASAPEVRSGLLGA